MQFGFGFGGGIERKWVTFPQIAILVEELDIRWEGGRAMLTSGVGHGSGACGESDRCGKEDNLISKASVHQQ